MDCGRFPVDKNIIQKKNIKRCEHYITNKKGKTPAINSITYFNNAGNVSEQIIYSTPKKKSDTIAVILKVVLEYDESNRIFKENLMFRMPDTSIQDEAVVTYSNDSAYWCYNKITVKDTVFYGAISSANNTEGRLLSYTYYDSLQHQIAKTDYVYDSIGRIVLINLIYNNSDSLSQNKKLSIVYTYSVSKKDGFLKQKKSELMNGNVTSMTNYYYDSNGKCHHSVTLQNRQESREYFYYNEDGTIASRVHTGFSGKNTYHAYYYY